MHCVVLQIRRLTNTYAEALPGLTRNPALHIWPRSHLGEPVNRVQRWSRTCIYLAIVNCARTAQAILPGKEVAQGLPSRYSHVPRIFLLPFDLELPNFCRHEGQLESFLCPKQEVLMSLLKTSQSILRQTTLISRHAVAVKLVPTLKGTSALSSSTPHQVSQGPSIRRGAPRRIPAAKGMGQHDGLMTEVS